MHPFLYPQEYRHTKKSQDRLTSVARHPLIARQLIALRSKRFRCFASAELKNAQKRNERPQGALIQDLKLFKTKAESINRRSLKKILVDHRPIRTRLILALLNNLVVARLQIDRVVLFVHQPRTRFSF